MTLDEAIKHAEEVAEGYEKIKKIVAVTEYECECAEEHRQLAEWLKDYKRLKEQETKPGHWIRIGEEQGACNFTYMVKKCSECGFQHSLVIPNYFCPNCGVKMEDQNRTGHWIHPTEYGLNLPEHYCSECHAWEESDEESDYCLNCGAKMIDQEDEK